MGRSFRWFAAALLALALAAATPGWGAPGPWVKSGAPGVNVRFGQLTWLDGEGRAAVPLSRVGVAQLSFDGAAARYLTGDQGAFLNLQVSLDGNRRAWVVQNLYLHYPDRKWMLGASPSVQFDLGIPNGTQVSQLKFSVSLSRRPATAPEKALSLRAAAVAASAYKVGGRNAGGSELSKAVAAISAWRGTVGAPSARLSVSKEGHAKVPVEDIPEVSEDPNGCAPGAVARSIEYMLEQAGKEGDAQDIYKDLYEDMHTDPKYGTTDDNLVAGKKDYTESNGLPITTDMTNTGMGDVDLDALIEKLAAGADVEILITWKDGTGHVAMVTGITVLSDGSIQITYVDDPDQTDGKPGNQEHTITIDKDGHFDGGTVDGFVVETLDL